MLFWLVWSRSSLSFYLVCLKGRGMGPFQSSLQSTRWSAFIWWHMSWRLFWRMVTNYSEYLHASSWFETIVAVILYARDDPCPHHCHHVRVFWKSFEHPGPATVDAQIQDGAINPLYASSHGITSGDTAHLTGEEWVKGSTQGVLLREERGVGDIIRPMDTVTW